MENQIYIPWICKYYAYSNLRYVTENLFKSCILHGHYFALTKLQDLM